MLNHDGAKRLREFIIAEYGPEEHKACPRDLELAAANPPGIA
jgi:hypothetical protein